MSRTRRRAPQQPPTRRRGRGALVALLLAALAGGGWLLWTGGLLDGPVAATVRTSSVYAEPGVGLDVPAAQQIIGNRRLVVVLLAEGSSQRPAQVCDDLAHAAAGTVAVILTEEPDDWDDYGCQDVVDSDEQLGRAVVIETRISAGVGAFPRDPLDVVKVVVVNYDLLVRIDFVPEGARVISPSLPRYLAAAALLLAVVGGAAAAWWSARRLGARVAALQDRRRTADDERTLLSAQLAELAGMVVAAERRRDLTAGERRRLATAEADYTALAADVAAHGGPAGGDDSTDGDGSELRERADRLRDQLAALSG